MINSPTYSNRQRPFVYFALQPPGLLNRSAVRHCGLVRSSILERFHAAVLLSVLPLTVFWLPLFDSDTLGTLTLLDCALIMLWVTTLALFLGTRTQVPSLGRHCAGVCVLAVLIGGGYAIGTTVFGQTSNLGRDLLRFMKIFGFPSIIPLSVCLASRVRRIYQMLIGSALFSIGFNVGIPFTSYQDKLPLFSRFSDLSAVQVYRPTGAVSNPNDYAYISIAGLLFALAWLGSRRPTRLARIVCFMAVVASLYGIVTSGSRSAMVGIFCGAIYYVTSRPDSIATKVRFGSAVLLFVACGWQLSGVFRERMDMALTQRGQEPNFAGRLEAQTISLRTWTAWPLGVGSSNMAEATAPYAIGSQGIGAVEGSDSIYVDILLGAGIGGLACLLLCFGSCWKLASTASLGRSRSGMLRAGMLSMFCIGFASLAPATSFVAPFFFTIVGLAALPEEPLKASRPS